jgi:hypothetical protein
MWDEMVAMIVIEKDNKMDFFLKAAQTNVEGSFLAYFN